MRYLDRTAVARAIARIDVVAEIAEALRRLAAGEAVLPDEAYLPWTTASGHRARSLSLPAADARAAGVKIINSSLANPDRALPRASGLYLLLDRETAHVTHVLQAAQLSALRTAAVTAAAAEACRLRPARTLALIGAGELAAAHLSLLARRLPALEAVAIHDVVKERACALAERAGAALDGVAVRTAPSAAAAIDGADLVVPCTTTTTPYIEPAMLAPGALVVNVSLDDVSEEVLLGAHRLYVDDWGLVADDEHRLLGRLARAGRVAGPGEAGVGGAKATTAKATATAVRSVDAELGELLGDPSLGPQDEDGVVVVNPFGLAVEDLALACAIARVDADEDLGINLEEGAFSWF
jgi:ornithine cyclodeaminase/alanine dehydrogenase-like protein (mu-crystallin family)